MKDALESSIQKTNNYDKQYNEITFLTQDLRSGIEHLVKLFQKTNQGSKSSKPTEPTTTTPESTVDDSPNEEPKLEEDTKPVTRPNTASAKAKVEFAQATDAILGSHGVNDTNLLSCLGLIEQKTNEFLTLHYIFNVSKKSSSLSSEDKGEGTKEATVTLPVGGVGGLLGQGPMIPIGNLSIVAPSTG